MDLQGDNRTERVACERCPEPPLPHMRFCAVHLTEAIEESRRRDGKPRLVSDETRRADALKQRLRRAGRKLK